MRSGFNSAPGLLAPEIMALKILASSDTPPKILFDAIAKKILTQAPISRCPTILCTPSITSFCIKLWSRTINNLSTISCADAVAHLRPYGPFTVATGSPDSLCSETYSGHVVTSCEVERSQFYWELVGVTGPCTIYWQTKEFFGPTPCVCIDYSYTFPAGATISPVFEVDEDCSTLTEAFPNRSIQVNLGTCASAPC